MNVQKGWPILKGTFSKFGEDNILRLSAALAYYAMFSIGPLLVIAVGLAGLAFGHDSVRRNTLLRTRCAEANYRSVSK